LDRNGLPSSKTSERLKPGKATGPHRLENQYAILESTTPPTLDLAEGYATALLLGQIQGFIHWRGKGGAWYSDATALLLGKIQGFIQWRGRGDMV
jgi:hypothetical protein